MFVRKWRARRAEQTRRPYRSHVGRRHRVLIRGGIYHVTARGTGPIPIYRDAIDRHRFVRRLAVVESRYGWLRRALCLMTTHYHLLVETPEPNLSAGIHQLNGLYAQLFNRRHGRAGALFQGRFHAVLVETDEQLDAVRGYIAANPVRAGLCARAEDWPWSWY
jgi:REP element-mobilizing transposase RayT